MINFQKVHDGLDTVPLLNATLRQPELWNIHKARKEFPEEMGLSPHREVEDIILRGQKLADDSLRSVVKAQNDLQCYNYDEFLALPSARHFIFGIMTRVEATQLGRVIITKLAPGKKIYEHTDEGKYSEHYSRFHVVLQGSAGTLFTIEDEQVSMRTGEVWWVNKLKKHSVANNSNDDRVHLIIDVATV